jgi:hypothetical protein
MRCGLIAWFQLIGGARTRPEHLARLVRRDRFDAPCLESVTVNGDQAALLAERPVDVCCAVVSAAHQVMMVIPRVGLKSRPLDGWLVQLHKPN